MKAGLFAILGCAVGWMALSSADAQMAAGPSPDVSTYCSNAAGTAWVPCPPPVNVPTANTAQGLSSCASGSAGSGLVCKGSAGNLYGAYVSNPSAAGFLMVFNGTTIPADGPVTPAECLPVASGSYSTIGYQTYPEPFSGGIVLVFSTTGCFTKTTSSGTAYLHGVYQ